MAYRGPAPLRLVGPGVAGLFSLLVVAGVALLPLFGIFLGLLAALPLVHLVASGRSSFTGWGWVGAILVGAALVTGRPWVVAVGFAYLMVAALPAVSVEVWLRRPWSTGRWVALVAGAALVMVAAFLTGFFHPASPFAGLAAELQKTVSGNTEVARLLVGSNGDAEALMSSAMRITSYLAPSLAALYVVACILWLRPRLPMLGLARGSEPFAAFASEEWLPVAFALGGLGWVFAGGTLKWFAANLFVVVLGLYFLDGLAIIHYYLGRRLAGNRWIRLALAFFALQVPFAFVLTAAGLTDTFFSLRRGASQDGGKEA